MMHFPVYGVFFVANAVLVAIFLTPVLGWTDSVAERSGPFQTVAAEQPQTAPLSPQVRIQRAGRLLTMDFDLVDAQGQRHNPGRDRRNHPPTFTVFKDGQPIGSGSFEYG
ncbi:MAG: hypothetical protein EA424_18345 [Planctomycetaceae bacterium]|nr:MAG: hypothetical protein EA424_18345 [Planctomycetaceae bacterium]